MKESPEYSDKCLAWVYQQMRKVMASMPSSMEDFFPYRLPEWMPEEDEGSDYTTASRMIEIADSHANKILGKE